MEESGYTGVMRKLVIALLVLAPVLAQNVPKAPPGAEEALRARVSQFYGLFRDAKFRQAEALIAEQSRDIFYTMSKVPISDFRIESIAFDDSFQTAQVLVSCLANTPRTAGLGLYVPVTGRWNLIDGQWFLVLELRNSTPWGPIGAVTPPESKQAAKLQPPPRASLETLTSGAFGVDPLKLVFSARGQQVVVQSVQVRNNLPGLLTLEIEGADLPGLSVIQTGKNIPAQSQISFQLKYNPQVGRLSGAHEITVRVQPLNLAKVIQLRFE